MEKTEFEYTLTRMEYRIQSCEIDQYNQPSPKGEIIVHAVYADYMEARDHLEDFAVFNQYSHQWSPKEASHGYWRTDVITVGVRVASGSLAEVVIVGMGMTK